MLHEMLRNFIIITMVSFCNSVPDQEPRSCLVFSSNNDPKNDAKNLCNAIRKGSIDESATQINEILCYKTFEQRKQIVEAFPGECENRNLLDAIKGLKNITDKMVNLMEFMLSNPIQIYATIIQNIASGAYEDNGLITYIVCSLNNAEKAELAKVFPTVSTVLTDYGIKHGEEYKCALLDICLAPRSDEANPVVTNQVIDSEFKRLKETNGEDFIKAVKEIIKNYSNPNLKKILMKYSVINGCDLGNKILEVFPPTEKELYATLVRSIEYISMFYAKLLHHFIKEESNKAEFHAINYVITIRTDYDLENIFIEYRKLYNNTDLLNDIQERFGDDKVYCETIKVLVVLCPEYSAMAVEYFFRD